MATLVTEEYFWDGDEIVNTRSSVAGESHYYMIDPNTGDVLFDQKGSTVYVTLTDYLGTVRDLVNSNGQIVNHLVYDAFGNRRSETNPQGGAVPFSPQMGFTGQWFDVATGLQYNHHRWFDPVAGRWLSEDPIGFGGGDGNLYRYVGNQVATYLDASGLEWFNNDWHDWINPIAWTSWIGTGVGEGAHAAIQFVRSDCER